MNNEHQPSDWNYLGAANLMLTFGEWLVGFIVLLIFGAILYFVGPKLIELPIVQAMPVGLPTLFLIVKAIAGLVIFSQLMGLVLVFLRHRAIRYRLAPDSVVHQGGVYRTFTHTIPGTRVQGVEVTANPLQRIFKVSTVTITTAGVHSPNMTIVNVPTVDAVAIQNQLGVDHVQ